MNLQAGRTADVAIARALDATQASIDDALARRSQALLRVTAGLAQVPHYVARITEALAERSAGDLLDQADEFRIQTGATWALLTDASGILQAWTFLPQLAGDDLSESSLVGLALEGDSVPGAWVEPTAGGDVIFQAVAVPVFDPGRQVVQAVLITGLEIDQAFAEEVKRHTGSELVLFGIDTLGVVQPLVTTLAHTDLIDAVAALDLATAFGNAPERTRVRLDVDGETLVGVVGALFTASGFPVAGYVGFRSRDEQLAPFTRLRRLMLAAFMGGLVVALLTALAAARQITRPLKALVGATQRVSAGQYTGTVEVHTKDEIGELALAFQRMLADLRAKDELVELLTSANATVAFPAGQLEPVLADREGVGERQRPAVTTRFEVGQVIANRYEIQGILGIGGMGIVYRAHDRELHEPVAIKILRPDAVEADSTLLERFKQEIRLARRITHRNVVRTHDIGELAGLYYITMEFVEGTPLKTLIQHRGRLTPVVAVTIGTQVCRALEAAHEQGVIHRDVKPHNVIVDPSGTVKVMDFGIARLADRRTDERGQLTGIGVAIGTPEYMAPEQLLGQDVDARTDVYAVGATLYECLTGRLTYEAPNLASLVAMQLEATPRDPRELDAEIPSDVAAVIMRALARDPAHRFGSARELRQALERVQVQPTGPS